MPSYQDGEAMVDTTTATNSSPCQVEEYFALFRAIHNIPLAVLKGIICKHYGAKNVDPDWRSIQETCQHLTGNNKNLSLYINITAKPGRKDKVPEEIMSVWLSLERNW